MNSFIRIAVVALVLAGTEVRAGQWEQLGKVVSANQFNATVGTDGCIHIISDRYLRVNTDGEVVETNTSVKDGHMGMLDYFPAIAAGSDGSIHIVTRDYGGSYNEGHIIRYWKRNPDGTWGSSVKLADPSARNYIVAVVATDDGSAWAAHSYHASVGAVPRMYKITGGVGSYLGEFTTRYMRDDTHIRMEVDGNNVVMVLSDHYGAHPVSMFRAPASGSLPSALQASRWTVGYNEERQGMVGTHMYDDGMFDMVYGTNITSAVRFCRYRPDKSSVEKNVLALSDMGRWHCADGCPEPGGLPPIAVVAGTPDKQTVMAVGITGDATEHLDNGELVYAVSTDGGATFGAKQSLGKYTSAGDGRLLPRLLYLDGAFFLVYRDNSTGGASIARYTVGTTVVTGPAAPAPVSPADAAGLSGNPTFVWNTVDDADGISRYEIQIDNNVIHNAGTETTFTRTPALSVNAHTWRVRAVDGAGNNGAWSRSRSLNVIAGSAEIISGLTVNDGANASDWSVRSGLGAGDVQYGDRDYTLATVPAALAGSAWIRTANDSKSYAGTAASFTVLADADVYVAHNDNITALPAWLNGWTDSGLDITNNETEPVTFSLYMKTFASGATVSLGANGGDGDGMYSVIVTAAAVSGITPAGFDGAGYRGMPGGALFDLRGRPVAGRTDGMGMYLQRDPDTGVLRKVLITGN